MVVAHNLLAANANRQFGIVSNNKKKSTEKLSSGFRINRASDDAAGLKISEKLRWQVRGLNKASTNIQDGISLLQVTDGALGEAESVVQRIRELSVQAANDTNTSMDRDAIQQEIDQNVKEFDRIAESTTFNGITPLRAQDMYALDPTDITNTTPTPIANNGMLMDDKDISYVDMYSGQPKTITGFEMSFAGTDKTQFADKSFFVTCSQYCEQTFEFSFKNGGGDKAELDHSTSNPSIKIEVDLSGVASGDQIPQKIAALLASPSIKADSMFTDNGLNNNYVIGHANRLYVDGSRMVFYPTNGHSNYSITPYSKTIKTSAGNITIPNMQMGAIYLGEIAEFVHIKRSAAKWGLKIQSGALEQQAIEIPLTWMEAKKVGIGNLNVDSFEHAGDAIDRADRALAWLNERRSEYGALQNRLEYAMACDDNIAENTDASESRIRDTDMAKEMVNYSKHSILEQAGQAMLSQANQITQGVLSLIQ